MLVLVGSHFLEAYPEHDVLAVRVPEAEPVAAVPLLPRRQLLAVLVLAAPPKQKHFIRALNKNFKSLFCHFQFDYFQF